MSRLLNAWANLLEASVKTPERFCGKRTTAAEANRRLRVVALLRALTPDEGAVLLSDGRLPDRITAIAETVKLPPEECERVLLSTAWRFTEGLHMAARSEAEPLATPDPVT